MSKTIISTYGTVEGFAKSALMGLGASQADPNGRFYIDGSMVNVELSQTIAEAIYISEIFRNGQSVTDKYTTDRDAGAVRVMLDTPFDQTSRTLSFGGRKGTPGNAGTINVNPPLMPTNNEIMVYLNQVNDQAMLFPDLAKTMIPLDVMAKKIASYSKAVVQDRTASTLAEILAYSILRALNDGDNVNKFDPTIKNAYAKLIAELNTKLDNGDIVSGAYTFSTEGRTIIGRPSFINNIFGSESGIILNGGDLAQKMLNNYDLSIAMADRNLVGTGYKGNFGQFHFQSAPDYIWSLAEKYLSLVPGALSNVYAIAVSFEATAMGKVTDLGVKIIDANEGRGLKAQPLNKWGHETFRKCQIIGKDTFNLDYLTVTLGLTPDTRLYPVAPATANRDDKVVVPIYNSENVIIGYRPIAEGVGPNGGNWNSGIPTAQAVTASVPSGEFETSVSVELTSATDGATIYYTTNGEKPTTSSTPYSTAITVDSDTVIKAIAVKLGHITSNVSTFTYTMAKVTVPVATPKGGTYNKTQSVTLTSATDGATIYYTTDGETPTSASTAYSTAISIAATATLKAIAIKSGLKNSNIMTESYTIT